MYLVSAAWLYRITRVTWTLNTLNTEHTGETEKEEGWREDLFSLKGEDRAWHHLVSFCPSFHLLDSWVISFSFFQLSLEKGVYLFAKERVLRVWERTGRSRTIIRHSSFVCSWSSYVRMNDTNTTRHRFWCPLSSFGSYVERIVSRYHVLERNCSRKGREGRKKRWKIPDTKAISLSFLNQINGESWNILTSLFLSFCSNCQTSLPGGV